MALLDPTTKVLEDWGYEVTQKDHGFDVKVPGKRARLFGLEEPKDGNRENTSIRWYGNTAHNADFEVVAPQEDELSKFTRYEGFETKQDVARQIEQICVANPTDEVRDLS